MASSSKTKPAGASKQCSKWLVWLGASVFLMASAGSADEKFDPKDFEKLKSSGHCTRCRLAGIEWKGGEVHSGRLTYAVMSGATLDFTLFEKADMRFVQLDGASLKHAVLKHADLQGANFRGADLTHANLVQADLRNADLREADLRGANLRTADITGSKLHGADLSTVKGLNRLRLQKACGDEKTKLPNRLEVPTCDEGTGEVDDAPSESEAETK